MNPMSHDIGDVRAATLNPEWFSGVAFVHMAGFHAQL